MKSTASEIENKVEELLTCLDKDSQHIQESLSQLNKLRSFVIKRDDSSLSKLLKVIQTEANNYRSNESERQKIRKELANSLGYNTEQLTLSVLEENLPKNITDRVINKKAKLLSLVKEF